MKSEFAIVDLFAGPGGLAEGFSSIRRKDGSRPFRIVLSIEKDAAAFHTLRLRNFLRQFPGSKPAQYYNYLNGDLPEPDWEKLFPEEWLCACEETLQLELGSREALSIMDTRIAQIKKSHGENVILIGGPPCQAYSLVGRARNKGIKDYEASKDNRHFLYQEYIRILQKLRPVAFIMENVKGLLSSAVDGELVFDRVLDDLSAVGSGAYRLVPLTPRSHAAFDSARVHQPASDFVVRAEDHGVPQARHRVIILGVKCEALQRNSRYLNIGILPPLGRVVTVADVLRGMPKLRSGLSELSDDAEAWREELSSLARRQSRQRTTLPDSYDQKYRTFAGQLAESFGESKRVLRRNGGSYSDVISSCPNELRRWLVDNRLTRFPNHETRAHMISDLERYFFVSLYGKLLGVSPKASDFPHELAPSHRNWLSGKFADRFRVQLWHLPGTTVTSHISKDGHYFIHPDPAQCRSLTVREAARLQTFPDNYFFHGNRTQQFTQVGNAVPPFLAHKIAAALYGLITTASQYARGDRSRLAS